MAARATHADCLGETAAAADIDYRHGLSAYRTGDLDGGFGALAAALARCPANVSYVRDYVVVAVAAGHPDDALDAAERAGLTERGVAPYVLEALARAARDTGQPDLAIRLYDAELTAGPSPAASVGRDLALLQRGDADVAAADLARLAREQPDRIDVLDAQGLVSEYQGDPIGALGAAEAILAIEPTHAGALSLRYRALLQSGAPQLATALTPASLTTAPQRERALRDTLALDYRWARDTPGAKPRADALDAVIARMRAAAADASLSPPARSGIRGDLIEALAARGHAAEAIERYDALRAEGGVIPAYVTEAIVGAFVVARQPGRAIEAYRSLPAGTEPAFETRIQYFFALLEAGHSDAALAASDALVAQMAGRADAPNRADAAEAAQARVTAALARSYTERPAEGTSRLQAVLATIPADRDARVALAETDMLRGWPRRAAAIAAGVATEDPDDGTAVAKLFDARLQAGDFRAAHATLNEIADRVPADDAALGHAVRDWQTHEMAEVVVDGQWGRSHGGRPGVIDSSAEEFAYSPPLGWDYRAFVHLNQAEGTPVQGTTMRKAVGAGIEWHTSLWLATAELLDIEHNAPAPQLSLKFTPGDQWSFGGDYALRTLDIPIAAFVVGVHADRIALEAGRRLDESREFGATLDHESFSDGNSRSEAAAIARERWVAGPVYTLDTRTDVELSANTLSDTNYFNPHHDALGLVTLENRWLQYSSYERALRHEVDVGLGGYVQQGHGAGPVAALRYRLTYEVGDRLALSGGASTTSRPYDGQRERLDTLNFNVTGRF